MSHRRGARVLGRLLSHAGSGILTPLGRGLFAAVVVSTIACARADLGTVIDIDGRQVAVQVPSGYDETHPTPVVILLHGFGSSGVVLEDAFHFAPLAEELGFLYLHPDGTKDCEGRRFWDASEVCCDMCGVEIDDAGFLLAVIDRVKDRYNVDDQRVYLVGHSNGGFMGQAMACEHADVIAGVASLAGAGSSDPILCQPSEPVHWLQIHGTADERILFSGGIVGGHAYPGAIESAEQWAAIAGCELTPEIAAEKLDLVTDLPGAETSISRHEKGCSPGGSATLWTMEGGAHTPALSQDFARQVVAYLLAHPKSAVSR